LKSEVSCFPRSAVSTDIFKKSRQTASANLSWHTQAELLATNFKVNVETSRMCVLPEFYRRACGFCTNPTELSWQAPCREKWPFPTLSTNNIQSSFDSTEFDDFYLLDLLCMTPL